MSYIINDKANQQNFHLSPIKAENNFVFKCIKREKNLNNYYDYNDYNKKPITLNKGFMMDEAPRKHKDENEERMHKLNEKVISMKKSQDNIS